FSQSLNPINRPALLCIAVAAVGVRKHRLLAVSSPPTTYPTELPTAPPRSTSRSSVVPNARTASNHTRPRCQSTRARSIPRSIASSHRARDAPHVPIDGASSITGRVGTSATTPIARVVRRGQIMNLLDETTRTLRVDENGDAAKGAMGVGFAQRLIAGGSAGCIACTLTYPLDLIRTRLAAQTTVKHYNGIGDAFMKILRDEGAKGLYRGLKPTLIGVGPNLALNFAAYETLRNHLQELDHGVHPMVVDMASGSAAAVVSATATFPIDLVRRRMQMRDATRGDSFTGVFKRVLAKEGFTGLYRGILPEFAKVAPGVAITYTSYAFLKRLAGVDTGRL
ncbi:putative peroxisomal Ca-dependent solute carrier protein, partial [Ostreococcus tauri]